MTRKRTESAPLINTPFSTRFSRMRSVRTFSLPTVMGNVCSIMCLPGLKVRHTRRYSQCGQCRDDGLRHGLDDFHPMDGMAFFIHCHRCQILRFV